jgi:hypothetical protein
MSKVYPLYLPNPVTPLGVTGNDYYALGLKKMAGWAYPVTVDVKALASTIRGYTRTVDVSAGGNFTDNLIVVPSDRYYLVSNFRMLTRSPATSGSGAVLIRLSGTEIMASYLDIFYNLLIRTDTLNHELWLSPGAVISVYATNSLNSVMRFNVYATIYEITYP